MIQTTYNREPSFVAILSINCIYRKNSSFKSMWQILSNPLKRGCVWVIEIDLPAKKKMWHFHNFLCIKCCSNDNWRRTFIGYYATVYNLCNWNNRSWNIGEFLEIKLEVIENQLEHWLYIFYFQFIFMKQFF